MTFTHVTVIEKVFFCVLLKVGFKVFAFTFTGFVLCYYLNDISY